MSKEMTELYQELVDNYVAMGYTEENFYTSFPIKAVIMLEYLYNYEDKEEIKEAIEYGYLETLIPYDILTEIADLEERFKVYTAIREYGKKQPELVTVSQNEEDDDDFLFEFEEEDLEDTVQEVKEVKGEVQEVKQEIQEVQEEVKEEVQEVKQEVTLAPEEQPVDTVVKFSESNIVLDDEAVDVVIPMPSKEKGDIRESLADIPSNIRAKLLHIKTNTPQVVEKVVALCVKSDMGTSTRGNYLNLQFKDIEGNVIGGKLWSYSGKEEDAHKFKDQICSITGKWSEFNGKPQLVATNLEVIIESTCEKCHLTHNVFSKKSDKPLEDYSKTLLSLIQNMVDTDYKNLLDTIFVKHGYLQKYCDVPAGISFHHSGKGQLLQHSVEVATTAISLSTIYSYMTFNMNLVVAGALLHDIGKVIEMPKNGGLEYSHTGYAVGHMGIGVSLLTKFAMECNMPEQKLYDLLSIVMTHHGEVEKGSPVNANSPDAMLVHMADETSAMLNHMWINSCDLTPHKDVNFSKGRNYIRLS